MSDEYIPPTELVRHNWGAYGAPREEFDRWFSAHDREVAEQAWDEGYEQGRNTRYGSPTPGGQPYDPDPNPYAAGPLRQPTPGPAEDVREALAAIIAFKASILNDHQTDELADTLLSQFDIRKKGGE